MLARLLDKVEVECEVMLAGYHSGEHFPGHEEVPQVSLGVMAVHERGAVRIKRGEIVLPLLVPHIHYSVPGKEHSVASVPGRHHAVEHIHTPLNGLEQVGGSADTHEVTRHSVIREHRTYGLEHLIHLFRRLSYGKTAYGYARVGIFQSVFGCLEAEVGIDAALDYREEGLGVAVERLCLVETPGIALKPSLGEFQ